MATMASAVETADGVRSMWRPADPPAIETELAHLWTRAAEDGPVSRALMSNLVVVRPHAPLEEHAQLMPDADVLQVARQHPARTILLNYSPASERPCAPAAAGVGVVTFGDKPPRYGVEVIAVDAACAVASIPSIIRWLVRGDVPTTVWWMADLSRIVPPAAVLSIARQIVYDSSEWRDVDEGTRAAAAIVSARFPPDLADLNWRRVQPLRMAIVHALATSGAPQKLTPADIRIQHRPGEAAAAWLMAAWFCCRLKWNRPAQSPVETREGDDFVKVTIGSGETAIAAGMSRQRIKVTAASAPTFRMPVPHETVADAVVAELRSLGHDRCLREAVTLLAALAQ